MTTAYDVAAIRADFPILAQDIRGNHWSIWIPPPRPKSRAR